MDHNAMIIRGCRCCGRMWDSWDHAIAAVAIRLAEISIAKDGVDFDPTKP